MDLNIEILTNDNFGNCINDWRKEWNMALQCVGISFSPPMKINWIIDEESSDSSFWFLIRPNSTANAKIKHIWERKRRWNLRGIARPNWTCLEKWEGREEQRESQKEHYDAIVDRCQDVKFCDEGGHRTPKKEWGSARNMCGNVRPLDERQRRRFFGQSMDRGTKNLRDG